jgi:hypothetical protein
MRACAWHLARAFTSAWQQLQRLSDPSIDCRLSERVKAIKHRWRQVAASEETHVQYCHGNTDSG